MNEQAVVVTGVSGVLGTSVARHLANQGARVIGIDISREHPYADCLRDFVGGVNLSDEDECAQAFAQIKQQHESISALVNVAGGFSWETVLEGSTSTWDRLWSLNVKTSLLACRSAVPLFTTEGGAIVNVSAAATSKAELGMAAYTATKSGVSRLTESLASELQSRHIRVNAVLPTIIDTPANRKEMPSADPSLWVAPEELANVIEFLISPRSSAVNGALLTVVGRM